MSLTLLSLGISGRCVGGSFSPLDISKTTDGMLMKLRQIFERSTKNNFPFKNLWKMIMQLVYDVINRFLNMH